MLPPTSFDAFLADTVERFRPEALMLLGEADTSAESTDRAPHPMSWAHRLFPPSLIQDHREFDRGALALCAFHHVLQDGARAFPWSVPLREQVVASTRSQVPDDDALDAWRYALLFNDLGKLRAVSDGYAQLFGHPAADHDEAWAGMLRHRPSGFPSFHRIAPWFQDALVQGLGTGFNLGSAVQMESADRGWDPLAALSPGARAFHLGHGFFDYLGSSGAHDPQRFDPQVVDEVRVRALWTVMHTTDPAAYRAERLERAGLTGASPGLGRLVGLARVFDPAAGHRLKTAWMALRPATRALLDQEAGWVGTNDHPAIELQYAPALLANAQRTNPVHGLEQGLGVLAGLWAQARAQWQQDGAQPADRLITNVLDAARAIGHHGDGTTECPMTGRFERCQGGYRWRHAPDHRVHR